MKAQKKFAKQPKGSNRREVTRLRIAKINNEIANKRKDFLHKLSTKTVVENQAIVLEDLNVSGMIKNRKLARAISQQGWAEFRTLCEAKSDKYGRDFRVISRWEPTSQVCSDCGFKWGKLDLSVRSVLCLNCGTEQDRDINAAKNIEKVGMGHRHDRKWARRDGKTVETVGHAGRVRQHNPMICQESPLFKGGEYVNLTKNSDSTAVNLRNTPHPFQCHPSIIYQVK
ncbi:transposase [Moorena sp. SIO3I6]|uniref:RNA-guided endonuclease InsQ/TnpB family protein n=1 Tax=Moorena sp. SIO3I6 TaxID=2607831 RepID=UPI00344EE96F